MISKKFRLLLLSTAVASFSFMSMKAFDWKPVGDSVQVRDGVAYAFTGGVYAEGDRIINTDAIGGGEEDELSLRSAKKMKTKKFMTRGGGGGNTQFEATAADSTLNLFGLLNGTGAECPLKIDGDITLTADQADMTVNVQTETTIVPYSDPTDDGSFPGNGFSQIYFNVSEGRKITFNVDNDLEFKGRTLGARVRGKSLTGSKLLVRGGGDVEKLDMILTFKGKGQTIFNFADGTSVKFNGDIDTNGAVEVFDNNSFSTVSNDAGGTKVFITMENTETEVNNGFKKVLFKRKELDSTNNAQRNMILVGNNSIITFVSDDVTGEAHADDATRGNFACLGFDPSNNGTGRMILFVAGAYTFGWQEGFTATDDEFFKIAARFPFNDGSVVVGGHKVAGFEPAQIRTTLNYSVPAGGEATLSVCDNGFYDARDTSVSYNPAVENRRGLLVVNDVQNVSKRAQDPYWDFFNTSESGDDEELGFLGGDEEDSGQIFGRDWSYSRFVESTFNDRNVRNGFVVAVNGGVKVYHNTVFDYVAGSVNRLDHLAARDFDSATLSAQSTLMAKNPAACVVDGLDARLFTENEDPISAFSAADPAKGEQARRARFCLYGTGAALFRAAGSSKDGVGYIFNLWRRFAPNFVGAPTDEEGDILNPVDDKDLDWQAVLVVDNTNFDGYRLATGEHSTNRGQHVLEFEGRGDVRSLANNAVVDPVTGLPRDYAETVENAGEVNMPTLLLDHTCREVDAEGNVGVRPLTISDQPENTFQRYNSPAMFFNHHGAFFGGTTIVHSDVTKLVDGVPSQNSSYPAMLGGERFVFANARVTFDGKDRDRYRFPEVRLYNSRLDLQESLNCSGIRWVVRDLPGVTGVDASNSSSIRFFDHGVENDTNFKGYGRIFMLGSAWNTMADNSTNWITEGCYMNIFRKNAVDTDAGIDGNSSIDLFLLNGNQFPAGTPVSEYNAQRAQHLFLISNMEKGAANVACGWFSTQGDSGPSFPYNNTLYQNRLVLEPFASATPDTLFSLDALNHAAQASLIISGNFIVFSGFDKDGNLVKGPIERPNNSGFVYANHGGSIGTVNLFDVDNIAGTHENPEVTFETMIGVKVANDYNLAGDTRVQALSGRVDLPRDQVSFLQEGGVQPYGFTEAMFAAREDETGGFIRVSFQNANRDGRFDQTGAEEVVFNMFNREDDNRVFDPGVRALRQLRSTESVTAPVVKPARLLYIGSGDDIRQMRVAGATKSDPFVMEISGDSVLPNPGRVREFTTESRRLDMPTNHFNGEGDNAIIFLEFGGRIGLGNRSWDQNSGGDSWTVLGKDHVQIVAAGDGIVDLNSDLLISDKQALLASEKFSDAAPHRLTFRSDTPREIRIPAGGELDLSSFGQANNLQQIAFGGKARLVVEQGATIRFPSNPDGGVVLYFNDESELIFQGAIEPQNFTQPYNTSDNAQRDRIKIIGKGQIWGNKNGKIQVNGDVLVGVQSDEQTPETDVTISLNRQSIFNIGTETVSGGAFEVGNPTAVEGGNVNFTLSQRTPGTVTHIDRAGFFGLGAGVIDKHGNINGDADSADNPTLDADGLAELDEDGNPLFSPDTTNTAGWNVQALNNVGTITIDLIGGDFEHNNIFDGASNNASLMALGPAANYTLNVNGDQFAAVRGGGNIMLVPTGDTVFNANVWDFAGELSQGERYSLLSSAVTLLENAGEPFNAGQTFTFDNQADFFSLLEFTTYDDQNNKVAAVGSTGLVTRSGFVNLDSNNTKYPADQQIIVRNDSLALINGRLADVLRDGAARGLETDELGPNTFGALRVAQ